MARFVGFELESCTREIGRFSSAWLPALPIGWAARRRLAPARRGRRVALVCCAAAVAVSCGEGDARYDAADFAPPVDAAPPAGTWEQPAPPSTEELARQIAEEMRALEATGYLGAERDESDSASFTGTVPPPVGFGAPVGFAGPGAPGSASGFDASASATGWQGGPGGSATGWQGGPGGSATGWQGGGYQEPGAFRGQAEVGGVPLVGGTVDESGGGNSVYSVGGKVIELP